MTRSEVAQLFAYCCLFDGRLQADEGKIMAWFATLYEPMTFEFAKYFVGVHYSQKDTVIQPSYFNNEWARQKRNEKEREETKSFMLELEDIRSKSASPEVIEKYLAEIRTHFRKADVNAPVEENLGDLAPNQ